MHTDISGILAYGNDIIIFGTTAEELFNRLDMVLLHIKDYGSKLKQDKRNFSTNQSQRKMM